MLPWLVGVPLFAYLAALGWLYLFQRQLLFRPVRSRPELGPLAEIGVREVAVTTADGLSLLAWYLPPADGRPVTLYFHGNGGHIGHRAERLQRFAEEGYGVLMPEYRGYGGNGGVPSEAGFYEDARAAGEFLRQEGIAAERVVLYGESLGTGVAVHLAARQSVGALILESPFTSIAAVAQSHYPFVPAARLIWDRFDALAHVAAVRAPLLMLQGGRDRIVPVHLGAALFAAAPEPKERWFAAPASHQNLFHFGALDAAVAFIERQLR